MFAFISVLVTTLIALYSTLPQSNVRACNRKFGPAGQTECVLLSPHYQEYQCATCLTNSYIQLKSGRRHYCRDRNATYCWYQCQLELFGNDEGVTNEKCRCKAGETPSSSKTPLPSSCYSPTGTDCEWYKDCLERRFPCVGTSADYAMKYATHFCSAYRRNYDQFSPLGRLWVNAVRKCLQVSLAPVLRECNSNITCEFIQETAFKSHDCCYLGRTECSPEGAPSICDVDFSDWITVFDTIKDAFFNLTYLELQTFQSALHVGYRCFENFTTDVYNRVVETVKVWKRNVIFVYQYTESLVIEYTKDIYYKLRNKLRIKRSTDNDQIHQRDRFAVILVEELSKQLNEVKLVCILP